MRKLIILSAAILLLGCHDSTPLQPELDPGPELAAFQAPGGQGHAVKLVPFNGTGLWEYGVGDPTPCEQFGYPDDVSIRPSFPVFGGTALHLGKYTGATTNCMKLREDGSYLLLMHDTEIVAANGDRLWIYGSEQDSEVIVHPDMSFEILGPKIVGGTGRFENAEGWYDLYAESLAGGAFILLGEISSVGSSK